MASLRQDPESGIFRIRFRFDGRSYNRSLKTDNPKTASSVLGRTEENLRLIKQGRLDVPPKVDPATFVLSDGKINGQKKCKPITLGKLFETYQKRLPDAAKERLTVGLETTHIKNFRRLVRDAFFPEIPNFANNGFNGSPLEIASNNCSLVSQSSSRIRLAFRLESRLEATKS